MSAAVTTPATLPGLRRARLFAGLTHDEVAEAVGVHVRTLARWENGRSTGFGAYLPALERALGVTEADLRADSDGDWTAMVAVAIAEACHFHPLTGEPYYTPADVLGWFSRAVEMGAKHPQPGAAEVGQLRRIEAIPNAALRAAYERRERGDALAPRLARALGWEVGGLPDTTRVLRLLGVTTRNDGRDVSMALFVPYEAAVTLADALGLDYHDLGL